MATLTEMYKKAGDPAGRKTGATKSTYGSTYDFRKGSSAPDPRKKAVTSAPTKMKKTLSDLSSKKKSALVPKKKAAPAPKTVQTRHILETKPTAPAKGSPLFKSAAKKIKLAAKKKRRAERAERKATKRAAKDKKRAAKKARK